MLVHDHDRDDDPARWRSFLTEQGFGHLVAAGRGRDVAIVVPTQYVVTEHEVVLHLQRSNPVFAALAENPRAVLSVAGDWAFVPGAWKAIGDEDPARGIPTTYYAAVQITGRCTVETEAADVAATLALQLAVLDPEGRYVDPAEHGTRLGAIHGIRLSIDAVRAKYKYGGNVDDAHRAAVAGKLSARGGPGDAAALLHMRASGR